MQRYKPPEFWVWTPDLEPAVLIFIAEVWVSCSNLLMTHSSNSELSLPTEVSPNSAQHSKICFYQLFFFFALEKCPK